ncbi:helix-turn-helix domain-containing protein [Nonomuraea harbinensis]|uniref:MerR family transcriptional regulator n=1 Tax=Nonomuraea harbinensis TaxID=1286938 RepID=A0ABW1BUF5_9ACTN|nr:MerR family transcriptional regulator [Nonomuraea harbinensis]
MSDTWTIGELAERAADALRAHARPLNGRVREVPGERLIRWYTTIGLVDPPLTRRGRIARYGRRHLLQLVAVKRLQAEGMSIADIQIALAGAADTTLEATARLPAAPHHWPVPGPDPGHPTPDPHQPAPTKAPPQATQPSSGPSTPQAARADQSHATEPSPPRAQHPTGPDTAQTSGPAAPHFAGPDPAQTSGPGAPHLAGPDPTQIPAPAPPHSTGAGAAQTSRPAAPHPTGTDPTQAPAPAPPHSTGAGAAHTSRPAAPHPTGTDPTQAPAPAPPYSTGVGAARVSGSGTGRRGDVVVPSDGVIPPGSLPEGGGEGAYRGDGKPEVRARFWTDRTAQEADRAAEGADRPVQEKVPGAVHGVRLAAGVVLVLDGTGPAPGDDDVRALLAAAAPLLAVLEERGLT